MSYKIIKDISQDNFLFGGLIYHHKEIIDLDERDREFKKMVAKASGENINTIEDSEIGIENIYSLMASLENIKSSQSLSELAMNKTMQYFGNESNENPIDTIYNTKNNNNAFIDNGIKILDSDIIIFLSLKGIVGDVYDQGHESQRLAIVYNYDENLCINIGEVIDLKLIEDFLDYKNHILEIEE